MELFDIFSIIHSNGENKFAWCYSALASETHTSFLKCNAGVNKSFLQGKGLLQAYSNGGDPQAICGSDAISQCIGVDFGGSGARATPGTFSEGSQPP